MERCPLDAESVGDILRGPFSGDEIDDGFQLLFFRGHLLLPNRDDSGQAFVCIFMLICCFLVFQIARPCIRGTNAQLKEKPVKRAWFT